MNIAITGGIGCGKSAVIHILKEKGKYCIDCDKINADLLQEPFYVSLIEEHFPSAVSNGKINRSHLGNIIFNNKSKREELNRLSHPLILDRLLCSLSKDKDNFVEIPLLNQNKDFQEPFDRIWVIKCNYKNRLERIMLRDSVDMEFANKKICSQNEQLDYLKPIDEIYNNNDILNLRLQIEDLLKKI